MIGKTCNNCGAENDLILISCIYCGAILPGTDIEEESVELEELLQNCSKWIGKFEAMVGNPQTLTNAKQKDSLSGDIFGKVLSKTLGSDAVSYSATLGAVNRYMDILDVKAQGSDLMRSKVRELKERFRQARILEKKTEAKQSKLKRMAIIGLVIMVTFFIVLFVWMGTNAGKGKEKEVVRLENLMEDINTAVKEGNFDTAEILCAQLKWEYDDSWTHYDNETKAWDEKRETMLTTIREIRLRDK